MIETLKNDYLTIQINSLGAELQTIIDQDQIHRLHDGNPQFWGRRSPILFPIISRFVDQKYTYQNKEYHLSTHGFARNKEFVEYRKTSNSITYLLEDDEETFQSYPFHFQFFVTYTLFQNVIEVSFKIKNTGDQKMYFMVGGHPAFKVPLYPNEKYEDYYIEFEKEETVEKTKLNGNYLSAETEPFLNHQKIIPLKYRMFNPDAFVMKGLVSNYVELKSKKNAKKIRFYFQEFEKLAFWAPLNVDAPFVCFEPWNGISKKYVDPIEKKGLLEAEPNQEYECSFTIEVI